VRVFDQSRHHAITVTQMHGLLDLSGKTDTPARTNQARKLLALSQSVTKAGDIAVNRSGFIVGLQPNPDHSARCWHVGPDCCFPHDDDPQQPVQKA